jgi:MFS transporter, DHA1 family, 2-module integral membrane pump EmrD
VFTESKLTHSRTFFLTVLMLSSIGLVATDLHLPSLPFIERDLVTTKSMAKLSLALYLLSFSLSQLFYGPLSDRIGRRKTALLGLTLSLFGSLTCIFCWNISSLILGRFIQGLGLGVGSTSARSIRRDVHSGDDLAHFGSYIIIGTSILFAIAPALGGWIQHYMGWRITFLFMLIYTLFSMLCVWLWLPETHRALNLSATKYKSLIHHYSTLLTSPVFIGYSLCSSLAFGGLTAYLASSPFLFENILGLTSIEYGRLGLVIAAGLGLGGYFNKISIKSLGRDRMLLIGITLIFLSGLLMFFLALFSLINTFAIIVPMLTYSFGAGVTFTNAFAGAFHPFSKIAGFAGALFGCMQILGGAIASGLMTVINEKDQTPLSIILIVVGIAAYLCQRVAFRFSTKGL